MKEFDLIRERIGCDPLGLRFAEGVGVVEKRRDRQTAQWLAADHMRRMAGVRRMERVRAVEREERTAAPISWPIDETRRRRMIAEREAAHADRIACAAMRKAG